ncbi:MAG TPA: F0F1 ATP synthase subunit B [Pararhizobium sp.]|nr:F0F1 ATP synthase subunit B [Pararhizobium sp.]
MFVTPAYAQPAPPTSPTEGTHTQTGTPPAAEHHHFPPFEVGLFPSQLLWLFISFVLFYLFMQKAVMPRIGGILETRRDRIANDLDEAARLKDEADGAIAAYQQELAEARRNAEAIGQKAQDEARAKAEAERADVEAELAKKTAAAEKNIAEIKAAALGEVDKIAGETAEAIISRLTGASVSKTELAAAIAAVGGK